MLGCLTAHCLLRFVLYFFLQVNDRTVTQLLASTIEVHGIRIDADNLMEQYRKLKKIADEEVTTDDIDWVVERNMAKQ